MGRRLGRGGPILPLPPLEGGPLHRPGVEYSILAGIGAVGAVIAGIVLYKEKMNAKKIAFISMIVLGVIGIRLTSGGIRCRSVMTRGSDGS